MRKWGFSLGFQDLFECQAYKVVFYGLWKADLSAGCKNLVQPVSVIAMLLAQFTLVFRLDVISVID